MLRPLPFLTTRAATWSASLALHAGLAVAGSHVWGGAPIADAAPAPSIDVDVTWEAPHSPAPALDESAGENVPSRAAMHTHPYPVPPGHDARPHDPSLVHAAWAPEAPAKAAPASAPALAEQVVVAADPAPPRFVLSVPSAPAMLAGPIATGKAAAGVSFAAGAGGASDGAAAVLSESSVDVRARLLQNVVPDYPAQARAAEVEADLPFEIIVDERGAVVAAQPLSRAGYGLDEAALRAVERMRFAPAVRRGRAVRVRMRWPVIFRLR